MAVIATRFVLYPKITMPQSWVDEGCALTVAARLLHPEVFSDKHAQRFRTFFLTHDDGTKHPFDVYKQIRRLKYLIEHGHYCVNQDNWHTP